VKAMKDTSIRF